MQTVYVDLFFLINFSMDFLCIFSVSKFLSKRLSFPRAFLGAMIGGLYSVLLIFLPQAGISTFIMNILCCILICLLVFAERGDGIKALSVNCIAYFLSSVLLGGVMTAAFNLLNSSGITLDKTDGKDIPPWLTVSVAAASAAASYFGSRFIKRRVSKQTAYITVTLNNKELSLAAMYDSGNLLRDSISGRPVIVADKKHINHFFGSEEILNIKSLDKLDAETSKRVVLIPYSTASGSKTMVALRPQRLIINSGGAKKSADALIGFASVKCAVDGCSALIPSELL